MSRRHLNRGLAALLAAEGAGAAEALRQAPGLLTIHVDEVFRGPHQARLAIDEEGIEELAASIRAQGLMQPLVVRPRSAGGYELIAGERRWRAAQHAGLDRVAALVAEVDDRRAMAMGLIENMQREDLNPLEEAQGLERLRGEFGLTQQEVADAVGKSRPAVANLMRLLNLAPGARELLRTGALEMGHARALLPLPPEQQEALAEAVAKRGLSARQTEALARRAAQPPPERPGMDADTERLQRQLSERIGARVAISHNAKGKGRLVIEYASLDELEGILARIQGDGGWDGV